MWWMCLRLSRKQRAKYRFLFAISEANGVPLGAPKQVAVDAKSGNIYVLDEQSKVVDEFSPATVRIWGW